MQPVTQNTLLILLSQSQCPAWAWFYFTITVLNVIEEITTVLNDVCSVYWQVISSAFREKNYFSLNGDTNENLY